jgi:GAF domain-containing protein
MTRHSGASRKSARSRRPKLPKSKRRNQPNVAGNRPSRSGAETEVVQLRRELHEALEQQTATAEVLRVISSSPNALDPVFRTMLTNATRLCEADFGQLLLHQGDGLFLNVAMHNAPPAFAELRKREPTVRASGTLARVATERLEFLHVADCTEDPSYKRGDADFVKFVDLCEVRTLLGVPLRKDEELIGVIGIYRKEVRPFTEKQIALLSSFAAQAVIAIENARLLNELRQRTTNLTERTTDLTEALEQQTATSQVLQVISSSPGDLEPVFAAMLGNAARLCDAKFGNIFRWDSEALHLVATHNTPPAFAEARTRSPLRPNQANPIGYMLATQDTVHISDLSADARYTERTDPDVIMAVELGGIRTFVAVPMVKEKKLIGALVLYRQEVRAFTDKQIKLVKDFAAQAVIAIENARLLSDLRQRTDDLTESLEQQTGTSEVLQVISSSPGDLKSAFSTILENATRLCTASFGILWLYEGTGFRCVALHNAPAAFAEDFQSRPVVHPTPGSGLSILAETRQVSHVADMAAMPIYTQQRVPAIVAAVELGGVRTFVNVPMLKEGSSLIGAITVFRQEVRPFTDKQIELLKNFAAQAVIAIENARLLNELRQRTMDLTEALEQQTATSDVLQVISTSPGDLEPVFASMLEKAVRICDATFGNIYRWDGEFLNLVAAHNTPPAFEDARRSPRRPDPKMPVGRMLSTKTTIHVVELAADESYIEHRIPEVIAAVELGSVRTFLAVPLLKDNELIGALSLSRQELRPFTDKQIELVKNFAAQAVIAIENSRLLNELRESLDRQTATSEVLSVISSSRGDLAPVFQAILENATRICEAAFGSMLLRDGEAFRRAALHNAPPQFEELNKNAPILRRGMAPSVDHAIDTGQVSHTLDAVAEEPNAPIAKYAGARTLLDVPMLKGNEAIGILGIYRQEVRPFNDRQIELVKNFAAQAVIAIENARLLNDLNKLNQQLEQRVADQVGEIERMSRLRRFLPPQVADLIVASGAEKQLESHRREITALFCDLRGFTGFSESADPEDVMALLRDYHATIGEIIIKYNGTLERYAGDGVMVVFNDPVPVENPALQAVLMALEMREAIGALTGKWRRFGHDIGFGIGIAHGYATLGTIGFEGRFDYAAIGTVSNVASRLCDEAKPGQILISARVLVAVEDTVKVEPVGEFELKGIRRPLAAYNVLSAVA